ncbi:hypothetical protein [Amycolatopsis sp. SID8362]|uniref:hypothetical protein n=1 Tax=Amycolatopsis sp. SID8362 TaxID=2690346 RepID=UPI00136A07C9|nr:hypothetical protein [Amycolatopsis sp. SID8362]NBH04282.1 hypothetical protein [Amycolatopsis sp. SID8362]NED40981.1 hypothetical protein [Amycolatopsis sp. SID8362]
MKWSVAVVADGDRMLSREEVVELADAVAAWSGIATGIGTSSYGAQLLIEADTRDDAEQRARDAFALAARTAALPPWPISSVTTTSEDDEPEDFA